MIERAIGFGLIVNLLLSEVFGLGSGGLVVPGYLALYLDQPWRVAATFGVALATWATVKFGLSRLIILYGRRRFAVTVLCGFAISMALPFPGFPASSASLDLRAIGHVIPGLIANEMLSGGPLPTMALALGASVIVRILLFLTAGIG